MVTTRLDKSSLTRSAEYQLLRRVGLALGKETVISALPGDLTAIEVLDRWAHAGRKKFALARWCDQQRKRVRRNQKRQTK